MQKFCATRKIFQVNKFAYSENDSLIKRMVQYINKVCDNIREARSMKSISQEYMASVIGIDTSSYHRLEKGLAPLTLERLAKIAMALEVPVEILLFGHEVKPGRERSMYTVEFVHHLEQEIQFLRKQLVEKDRIIAHLIEQDPHTASNPKGPRR
jgi:transcriptional regulator with XRE-family HTH domain